MIVGLYTRHRWLWLVGIGMMAAGALTLIAAWPIIITQQYVPFRMLFTLALLLAGRVDLIAGVLIGVSLIAWFAGRLGRRIPGPAGRVLTFLLPLLILASMAAWYLQTHQLTWYLLAVEGKALGRGTLSMACGPGGLIVLLAACLWLLMRLHPSPAVHAWLLPHRARLAALRKDSGHVLAVIAAGLCSLSLLAFLVFNLATGLLWLQRHARTRQQPNVIFIMVDTLRADHIGCYGYDLPVTPNIDRFARGSLRFQHAASQASWTGWSVSSLISSRYPDRLFPDAGESSEELVTCLDPYYPTLAEVMHEQGYATSAVISNIYLQKNSGTDQGFDAYDEEPASVTYGKNTAPMVTEHAIAQIRKLKDRRFFLSLVYIDPHWPYFTHEQFPVGDSAKDARFRQPFAERCSPAQQRTRRQYLRAYDSEIAYTDAQIGRLFEALKREGVYDNSLIVFFSDHGEEFYEHGRNGHRETLYEEVTQVPLIVKLPCQRTGRVVQGTMPLMNLYPSLLAYLRVDGTALGLQGRTVDFRSILRCADQPVYSAAEGGVQCVRKGEYKYIRSLAIPDNPTQRSVADQRHAIRRQEVYHLVDDPREQRNLASSREEITAQGADLLAARDTQLLPADLAHAAEKKVATHLDSATLQMLKSLGYLQ